MYSKLDYVVFYCVITLLFSIALGPSVLVGSSGLINQDQREEALAYLDRRFLAAKTSFDNDITKENKLQGSKDWWIPQLSSSKVESLVGYTTEFSVLADQSVKFKIHARPEICSSVRSPGSKSDKQPSSSPLSSLITIDIYRLGYYGGTGGRKVATVKLDKSDCPTQPPCLYDPGSRMVDCDNWKVSASWKVPMNVVSGVFVALPRANGKFYGNYIPFVVRKSYLLSSLPVKSGADKHNPSFGSDILFKTADTTWVAYNKYGSWNVYRGNGSFQFDSRAFKASYNRPFSNRLIKPWGQHENFIFGSEFPLLFWLEQHGYDVSYASSFDVEEYGRMETLNPTNFRSLLSVGHDEYWTQELKDAFVKARNAGTNLAFFSGNEVFWKVRWSRKNVHIDNSVGIVYRNTENESFYKGKANNDDAVDEKDENAHTLLPRAAPRVIICRKETIDAESKSSPSSSSSSTSFSGSNAFSKDKGRSVRSRRLLLEKAPSSIGGGKDRNRNGDDRVRNGGKERSASLWTGTFMDPRVTGFSDAQNSLTGQLFMVNGFQNDTIEARIDELKLRFWRNTSAAATVTHNDIHHHHHSRAYVSPHGILGYEWDIFVDDCARPHGMIGMSTTHRYIKRGLLETYGASYAGDGSVTHRLTLYRHIHAIHSNVYNKTHYVSTVSPLGALDIIPIENAPTSLVFGTGTIQWSWGLSAWHDGHEVAEDLNMKQATMNILADMKALPTKASVASSKLVFPSPSLDTLPPVTMITYPATSNFFNFTGGHHRKQPTNHGGGAAIGSSDRHMHSRMSQGQGAEKKADRGVIRIRGSSIDRGGGVVAAVEVSVDRGKSWAYAHMVDGEKWYLAVNMIKPAKSCDDGALSVGEGVGEEGDSNGSDSGATDFMIEDEVTHVKRWLVRKKISIWARAVDDSGWIEGCCDEKEKEKEKSEVELFNKVDIVVVY